MGAEELLQKYRSDRDRLGDAVAPSDVFNRESGSEMTLWESNLLRNFCERLLGNRYQYRGFVRHTRNTSIVLLTPSPWILEGVFIYLPDGMTTPDEGAMIEVVGRNVAAPGLLERTQKTVRAILAESIESIVPDFIKEIRPPMSLRNLSQLLFEHVGMAENSKRVFARLFVSSPPYIESVGGLSAGIQALASEKQVRRLLRFMRDILPPSMRGTRGKTLKIRGFTVHTPRLWRMDVGQFNKARIDSLCIDRKDTSGYREVSLSTLTDTTTAALPDVPLALASEDFWIESRDAKSLRLPILKSAITFQMLTPKVSTRSIDSSTSHVLERLELIQESFGLAEQSLSRGQILDADALGRPLSVVRLARSTARASWKDKITAKDLKREWDRVLEPALKEFLELTQLKEDTDRDWGKDHPTHKYNTKVLKALKKLDTGKSGSLGPKLKSIAEEAGVESHVAAKELTKMKDDGVVYEPRPDHYRLV